MNRLLLILLLALSLAAPALAHDPGDLEENIPTELQDTQPEAFRQVEFQGMVRYIDEGEENRLVYRPILEIGILPEEFRRELEGRSYASERDGSPLRGATRGVAGPDGSGGGREPSPGTK